MSLQHPGIRPPSRRARLALLLLAGALALPSRPNAEGLPPAEDLVALVDPAPDAMDRLRKGEILTAEIKAARDTELGVGLAMLIRRPLPDVRAYVGSDALFAADSGVIAHGDIDPADPVKGLAGVSFGAGEEKEIDRLLRAEAGQGLNLSASERATLTALASGRPSPEAVVAQYRKLLHARLEAYASRGLAGIEAYDRGGGKLSAPADELRTAQGSVEALKRHVPEIMKALEAHPPSGSPEPVEKWLWLKQRAQGRPVFVLSHRMHWELPGAIVAIERQYFAGHSYNCSFAVAGLIESDDGTLVVYSSRVYTDEVAGGMGGLKRNVGRGMMTKQLRAYLDSARKAALAR